MKKLENGPKCMHHLNKKNNNILKKISTLFQNHLLDLINCLQNKTVKIKLEQNIERRMKRLFNSYEHILKGIEIQDKVNTKGEDIKKMRESLMHYDKKKERYKGWYVDLYKDNSIKSKFGIFRKYRNIKLKIERKRKNTKCNGNNNE